MQGQCYSGSRGFFLMLRHGGPSHRDSRRGQERERAWRPGAQAPDASTGAHPHPRTQIDCPKTHRAWEREDWGRWTSMTLDSGTTMGRKERECGATGVRMVQGTEGATMGPPALME